MLSRTRMSWLEIVAFVALGLVAGAYGTLVGVGGGLFIVPVLIFAHFAPRQAVGTSMLVVLANAVSGSLSFLRQKRVAIRTGLLFAIAGLPGAFAGAFLDQIIPRNVFSLLFGIFLLLMAGRLFFGQTGDSQSLPTPLHRRCLWLALLVAFWAGFLASLFGVGGGILYVPSMLYILQFAAHIATATSTFTIALTAVFGSISHAYYGDIAYGPAVAISTGAIVGAQIGARLASRIEARPLVRLFAAAVCVSAVWLIYHGTR